MTDAHTSVEARRSFGSRRDPAPYPALPELLHCDKDRGVGIKRYVIRIDYVHPLEGKV
jgi:hypothetical protein